MRIIAGTYASRELLSRKGEETRPTADKIKGAVFSSLQSYLHGNMLDCYSGTGNMGLEALSRGMDFCTMVDQNKEAVQVIKKNVKALQVRQCEVIQGNIFTVIPQLQKQYQIVYIDPPYAKQENHRLLETLDTYDLVCEEGWVIIESRKEDQFEDQIASFHKQKEKKYGNTKITYYRKECMICE